MMDTEIRSTDTERWIASFGVDFELFSDAPIDTIDTTKSLANQARTIMLEPDSVTAYSQAKKAGAVFPPLVGYFDGASVVLLDGNTRLAAAIKNGETHIAVYIVDLDPGDLRILDMIASANATLNGASATTEDRIRHAIARVDAGVTCAAAARLVGLPQSTVTNHVVAERVRRKADRLGLGKAARSIPMKYLRHLDSALDALTVDRSRDLIELTNTAKNVDDYAKFVRKFVATSDDDRQDLVDIFVAERTAINVPTKTHRRADVPPWQKFKMHAQGLANLTPEEILASCPPDKLEGIRRLADDIRYIATRIN